jgi:Lrp/AsnC family leucine-responsive transcriptional regulator
VETELDVDNTDHEILAILARDARSTYGDIGRVVGLSAPAVKRRVDRLVDGGVILGYTTRLDHLKLGRPLEAFCELRFVGKTRVDAIANIADDIPEVEEIFTIAGDPDALAWMRVKDVHDLKRVIDLLRGSGIVTGTKTLMVLGVSSRRNHQS